MSQPSLPQAGVPSLKYRGITSSVPLLTPFRMMDEGYDTVRKREESDQPELNGKISLVSHLH
jgi:hypothetical protein